MTVTVQNSILTVPTVAIASEPPRKVPKITFYASFQAIVSQKRMLCAFLRFLLFNSRVHHVQNGWLGCDPIPSAMLRPTYSRQISHKYRFLSPESCHFLKSLDRKGAYGLGIPNRSPSLEEKECSHPHSSPGYKIHGCYTISPPSRRHRSSRPESQYRHGETFRSVIIGSSNVGFHERGLWNADPRSTTNVSCAASDGEMDAGARHVNVSLPNDRLQVVNVTR